MPRQESTALFKRERDNFRRMQPELVKHVEYQDKFVAVHDNEVVGSSDNRLKLFLEVSHKFSDGTFYIGKVYRSQNKLS
jgi:hypothetical protein